MKGRAFKNSTRIPWSAIILFCNCYFWSGSSCRSRSSKCSLSFWPSFTCCCILGVDGPYCMSSRQAWFSLTWFAWLLMKNPLFTYPTAATTFSGSRMVTILLFCSVGRVNLIYTFKHSALFKTRKSCPFSRCS